MYASVRESRGVVNSRAVRPDSISRSMGSNPVWSDARAACCMLSVTNTIVHRSLSSKLLEAGVGRIEPEEDQAASGSVKEKVEPS
jgi:hypothetical protein